jgi:hypothetical protein
LVIPRYLLPRRIEPLESWETLGFLPAWDSLVFVEFQAMDGHLSDRRRTLSVQFEVDRQALTRLKQAYQRIQAENQVLCDSKARGQTIVAVSMVDLVTAENQG